METPLVSIACITYNQEKFVRECLDGFVMQQTDFPLEIVIHDDASTDSTQDIIREYINKYPQIHWRPILQTDNKYRLGKGILAPYVFPECKGKYIALCEGDDYWTDPLKLQKQVDYLETHHQCCLCYHACENLFEEGVIDNVKFGENVKESYSVDEILSLYPFQTATVIFQSKIVRSKVYEKAVRVGCHSGDSLLFACSADFGTIEGINEKMSVYRRVRQGASTINKRFFAQDTVCWIKLSTCFSRATNRAIADYVIHSRLPRLATRKKLSFFLCLFRIFLRHPLLVTRRLLSIIYAKISTTR